MNHAELLGKRPMTDADRGMEPGDGFTWFRSDPRPSIAKDPMPPEDLPIAVFARLKGGKLAYNHQWRDYATEAEAMADAVQGYQRAVAEGAMGPIEGVA